MCVNAHVSMDRGSFSQSDQKVHKIKTEIKKNNTRSNLLTSGS